MTLKLKLAATSSVPIEVEGIIPQTVRDKSLAEIERMREAEALLDVTPKYGADHEQACWDEAYGWRPNYPGPDGCQVYAHDLNGESLDALTEVDFGDRVVDCFFEREDTEED